MPELKPCPFCGSESVEIFSQPDEDGDIFYHVYCLHCDVQTAGYATEQFAAEAWNRRAGNA